MDARIKLTAIVVIFCSLGADYSTENFVVSAPDPQLAKKVAVAAEKFRRDLAIQWLGRELPVWPEKCPVTVRLASQAGGQTSFGFSQNGARSMPVGWQMEVYGSPERILDSVLPHEVTHTIFATHFGRPLPRWADEGACTTVEHESERSKNHELLLRFLTTNRGIPFNRMFVMKQYPHDIYPLYAQGYSLARFLIMQGGHKHFMEYIGEGMMSERPGREPRDWDAVTRKYYGYSDLSELQVRWVHWVKQGCPNLAEPNSTALAENTGKDVARSSVAQVAGPSAKTQAKADPTQNSATPTKVAASWYTSQFAQDAPAAASVDNLNSTAQTDQASDSNYRPGSIRASQPLEVLATLVPNSVSANRINSESNYFSRPEIEPAQRAPRKIWR